MYFINFVLTQCVTVLDLLVFDKVKVLIKLNRAGSDQAFGSAEPHFALLRVCLHNTIFS